MQNITSKRKALSEIWAAYLLVKSAIDDRDDRLYLKKLQVIKDVAEWMILDGKTSVL